MQRTIRVLRVALPIAFVGFIALLVFSWDRSAGRREREAGEPVTSTQRPEDRAQAEARAFEDVQTIGGRVVSRIRASRVVSFESGWTTLEGVALTIYRQNGLTYEIVCPEAQFNTTTKAAEAKGGVRLTSSDGIEILTAEIHFDGRRISNEIPVQFRIDRWTGNAGALDLDVETEALRLHRNVAATMAPPRPDEAPLTLRGAESMFLRAENRVEFRQGVEMDRGLDALSADWMMGLLSPDRRQLVALEGNGNCVIVTSARSMGDEGPGGSRARITSENFRTEIGPAGRIGAINASGGEGLARAVIDGPPVRDIVAKTFRVALTNQVVSEIKADWQVVMKEIETKREIRSAHVTVWFDPATKKARSAYLEGAFRYTDPRTTATAFRANYDIAGDRIVLTTDPGWQATVVADGQVLKAKQIEFSPRAETARASGAVIAQLVSRGKAGGPTADATAIFPSRQPVFVNADELLMNQATRVASFSGNVRAWQEKNTMLSTELQVHGNGDVVTARGGVRTVLYNTSGETSALPVQSRSDQLIARRGERRIELLGNVAIVDDTRRLDSEKATLFLDANQKVQRMEAEDSVRIAETATGRKGSGEKAIYEVDRKMIFVSGKPATISDPSGSVSGQQISFDLNRNRVQVVSPEGGTKGTYKHEG